MNPDVVRLRSPERAPQALSDEGLALACASCDPSAIAGLFDRFRQPLWRYLARLSGGGPDVDDLLQSTFVEIARGTSRYDPARGSVTTWLFGIATNVVRHHRRASTRRHQLHDAVAAAVSDGGSDDEARVDTKRKLERAREALLELSDELRLAFVLCELEGLSAQAAADALATTEAAVWKRVSKARVAIRAAVLEADR